jgi:flagellar hook-associated protein 1 FlgK
MSLTLALNTALSSLNVNQRSLATLSQNIANANNPEYSRKIVSQEAVYLQGTGAGVTIRDISRKVDDYLQKSVRNQGSVFGRAQVLADYSDRLQTLLGKPGSANSIYSYTSSFFNAVQSLSQTPENASLRTSVISVAQSAAREFSTLANGIYDMQYSIDQDIRTSVDTINNNLKAIYALNATISSNKLLGRSVSELEDSRDSKLNEISQLMDVQTYQQTNGSLNIFTAGGYSLIDENLYQISYSPAPSAEFFANNNSSSPMQIYRVDDKGVKNGSPSTIVSGGSGASVTTVLSGGKIKGLLELRDQQLPDVLAKLDQLAATMRDQVNVIHNSGTSFPGASSYTGTRLLSGEDYSQWTGSIRIAVLGQDGKPVPSNYSDEESGMRPLTIDLSKLDTGGGVGNPTVQGIINEINRYYGVPGNKVELGDVNDVRLVLNNDSIPGSSNQLNFDFLLDNISGNNADMYITDLQVLDDTNTDITNITQDVPKVALASTGTYTTTFNSNVVTVKTASEHGYAKGDRVYLSLPSLGVGGISAEFLEGYFTIDNVTPTGFTINTDITANASGVHDIADVTSQPSYATSISGTNARTKDNGTITANILGHTTSSFYTVKAKISVADADGKISTSTVTYRIDNLQANVKNYQYTAQAATDEGNLVTPNTIAPALTAKLVDANGNELPIINNQYSTIERGYLKLTSGNASYVIAIDSLDSIEQGKPNSVPPVDASGRAFSHYFELNNFFKSNRSDGQVDDLKGSATHMAVSEALVKNVNLISLGKLSLSQQPTDPTKAPLYTYERNFGDNSVIAALAEYSTKPVSFAPAGDLGTTSLSFSGYAGQMISTTAAKASTNAADSGNAKLLLDGFTERSDGVRGVNLDEELANTIIYQNAYSASARIITVANQFFDALMESVR